MDIARSKILAEELSGKGVIEEAIEGVYLGKEELPEEVSMFLEENHEEYMVYLNPIEDDRIVAHILDGNQEVLISYLADEDGNIMEVYCDTKRME